MRKDIEIFRGAGAMAALEAAAIRALLELEGIPHRGGRMRVVVNGADHARARQIVAAAFGFADEGAAKKKARGAGKVGGVSI